MKFALNWHRIEENLFKSEHYITLSCHGHHLVSERESGALLSGLTSKYVESDLISLAHAYFSSLYQSKLKICTMSSGFHSTSARGEYFYFVWWILFSCFTSKTLKINLHFTYFMRMHISCCAATNFKLMSTHLLSIYGLEMKWNSEQKK